MHRSNITGLVDRLESRGLVSREESPRDRRAFNVVLTPAGRKLVRAIQPHYYRAAEIVWGSVPVERARRMLAELEALSENATRVASEKILRIESSTMQPPGWQSPRKNNLSCETGAPVPVCLCAFVPARLTPFPRAAF